MAALASERGALRAYVDKTRAPRYSLIFALPLFLMYEALAAAYAGEPGVQTVRNAADVLLKTPFFLFTGTRGSLAFFATVIAVSVFLVARDLTKSRDRLQPRTFFIMLGESALLALLLGVVVGTLTQRVLGGLSVVALQGPPSVTPLESMSVGVRFMLSLGAGLYEELLFRVLLVGGMAFGLKWIGLGSVAGGIIATVIGALIFSAFHYIGEYGDPLELTSFTYRAIAAVVFSALYLTRGFGITAWSHALYDVYVIVL